jgi:hypothetical protein
LADRREKAKRKDNFTYSASRIFPEAIDTKRAARDALGGDRPRRTVPRRRESYVICSIRFRQSATRSRTAVEALLGLEHDKAPVIGSPTMASSGKQGEMARQPRRDCLDSWVSQTLSARLIWKKKGNGGEHTCQAPVAHGSFLLPRGYSKAFLYPAYFLLSLLFGNLVVLYQVWMSGRR